MSKTGKLGILCAVVMVCATSALGAALTSIGALNPASGGTVESKVYALSPDGQYVVGASNGTNLAGTQTMSQAVVWSAASGLVQLPNAGDQATSARGVVVKSNGDVGIAGYCNDPGFTPYRMGSYTVSPSNLAGGTWVVAAGSHNLTVGTYNAARTWSTSTISDWVIAGQRSNGAKGVAARVEGETYFDYSMLTPTYSVVANVVSRLPLNDTRVIAAGYDNGNSTRKRALFLDRANNSSGTQTVIPGSAGYQSEALGMSPSTTTVAGSGVIVGYDQAATAGNLKHAFQWTVGGGSMTLLSELPGDNQSEAIDVRIVGSNTIIGGYSSDGTTEKAVIWTNGAAQSLVTLLAGLGVDVSPWSSFSRITTMSDDGMTVAGWGIWAADGSTQGFVASIPEPATLSLLVMGACLVLRRRR